MKKLPVTPIGILNYPMLTKAVKHKDAKEDAKKHYKTDLILSKKDSKDLMTAIDEKVEEAKELVRKEAKKKFKKTKKITEDHIEDITGGKEALKPGKKVKDEEDNFTGEMSFNFKLPEANGAPRVFDSQGRLMSFEKVKAAAVASGTKARIQYELDVYCMPGLNWGVRLILRGVQIIDLKSFKMGGVAELPEDVYGFASVKGGFTADEVEEEDADPEDEPEDEDDSDDEEEISF